MSNEDKPRRMRRIPVEHAKDKRIPLRVSPTEYADIKKYADERGWAVNTMIRIILIEAGVIQDRGVPRP